jgi:peptide deformylase
MAILKIARLGNPVLRKKAQPIPEKEIQNPDVQRLIRDMVATMREYEGVGLAAPQVHESLQLIVIESLEDPDKPDKKPLPLSVLINPALTVLSAQAIEDWEGCLSVPDMRGLVPRPAEIKVQAYNPAGKQISFRARDFYARVIQHEYDHLVGEVYLDRMRSMASLTFLPEFSRYWLKKEKSSLLRPRHFLKASKEI